MAAWGNALGGWRKQKRGPGGRFAGGVVGSIGHKATQRASARRRYSGAKRANARAHRARVKGSAKARLYETVDVGSKRGRTITGGVIAAGVGKKIGSQTLQSYGVQTARQGVHTSIGRSRATAAWSKGLKKSRNRQAKERYRKEIGSTRAKRAARNGILLAGTAGLAYAAYKNGNVEVAAGDGNLIASVGRRGKTPNAYVKGNKIPGTTTVGFGTRAGSKKFRGTVQSSPTKYTMTVNGTRAYFVNKPRY